MAKFFLKIFLILLAFSSNLLFADDIGLEKIRKIVTDMSSDIKAEHIKNSPVSDWYTITRGSNIAYISSDGRHLIQGDMYDIETQVNLSENIRNDSRKKILDAYPIKEMIVFEPQEKKHAVTVFTDVDCTF